MSAKDIYIYGYIENEQSPEWAEMRGAVSLTIVKNQVTSGSQDFDEINLHIHSGGGNVFEGFAIHDYLRSLNKKITSRIEGLCASIATIVALAGDKRIMTENSTFVIHNPYQMLVVGESEELEKAAKELKEIEDRIANFYVEKTGSSAEKIHNWMDEEKVMTADEAKELGFVTEIEQRVNIAARFDFKKIKNSDSKPPKINNDMIENFQTEIRDSLKDIRNVIANLLNPPKDELKLFTADGKTLAVKTDKKVPNVNDVVTIDGKKPENGEFVMQDGSKIAVADGKITTITEAKKEPVVLDEKLNARILALEAENIALRNTNTTILNLLNQVVEKTDAVAGEIQSVYDPKTRVLNVHVSNITEETDPAKIAFKNLQDKTKKTEVVK